MRVKNIILGIVIGFALAACAGFRYRYYAPSLPDSCYDQGKLIGKDGKDGWPDLAFSECKPRDGVHPKCVVQLDGEFFSMKRDLIECRQALIDCQRGPKP